MRITIITRQYNTEYLNLHVRVRVQVLYITVIDWSGSTTKHFNKKLQQLNRDDRAIDCRKFNCICILRNLKCGGFTPNPHFLLSGLRPNP